MLAPLVFFAMLAGSAADSSSKPTTRDDPNRMICKYDVQPGSRLAKRKVCLTSQQWREWKQSEQLYLLRHQYNGSPK